MPTEDGQQRRRSWRVATDRCLGRRRPGGWGIGWGAGGEGVDVNRADSWPPRSGRSAGTDLLRSRSVRCGSAIQASQLAGRPGRSRWSRRGPSTCRAATCSSRCAPTIPALPSTCGSRSTAATSGRRFERCPTARCSASLTGLSNGPHTILARANGSGKGTPPGRTARLDVVNHPITGPLFSGPQQQPFFCETVQNGLGPPTDAACSAPTQVTLPLPDDGRRVRRARRPDRAAGRPRADDDARRSHRRLHRPPRARHDRPGRLRDRGALRPGAPPSPFTAEPGWNERLVYTFGGGCNVGYHQGAGTGRRAHRPVPVARLRRRLVEPQRLRQQLQRGDLRRGRADGQGALHRDLRRAALHDRLGRLGRRDPAAPDRQQLPGHPRRHPAQLPRSRTP